MFRLLYPLLLCCGLVSGQTAQQWLQQGMDALKVAQYDEAIDNFKQAIALDPKSVPALLHLATAYLADPADPEKARLGRETYVRLLELDPKNADAITAMASLSFAGVSESAAPAALDDARKWQLRVLELRPDTKESHYALGVIAWSRFYPAWQAARRQAGLKPEDPGPFKDKKLRAQLKAEWESVVQEGIHHLQRAVEIDPAYSDALTRLSLLVRERADWMDNQYAWLAEAKKADTWLKRANQPASPR